MDPLWTLAIGMSVVVGGILVLRLHAFLALIIGALVVAAFVPTEQVFQDELAKRGRPIQSISGDGHVLQFTWDDPASLSSGESLLVISDGQPVTTATVGAREGADQADENYTASIADADAISIPDDALLLMPQDFQSAIAQRDETIGDRVADAFGVTCGQIAILIAMAAIIGKCLLESGAADRIVRSMLALFGERQAPVALSASSFLLGIPVFFDTVFYLMIPLGKALRVRTGRNYLLYILAITAGATMAHSLVPPTPGPLLVASQMHIDVGKMILGGGCLGICTVAAGFGFSLILTRWMDVPLRESANEVATPMATDEDAPLPPFWLAILPILLPVAFIGGDAIAATTISTTWLAGAPPVVSTIQSLFHTLANKNIALAISAAIALATLAWRRGATVKELATVTQSALASGGVIILITAAGGAFGAMLKETGIGDRIAGLAQHYQLSLLPLAFFITAMVRTAQGSATVAMITSVGIVAPLADPATLAFDPLYVALAIGCGSKPISWMNDSGFWVVCKMTGMTESETLRSFSMLLLVMGISGLAVLMLAARVAPFPFG